MDNVLPSPEKIDSLGDFFIKIGQSNLAVAASFLFLLALVGWLFFGKSHEYYRVFAFIAILISAGVILYEVFRGGARPSDTDVALECKYELVRTGGTGPQPYDPDSAMKDKDSDGGIDPDPIGVSDSRQPVSEFDLEYFIVGGGGARLRLYDSACEEFELGNLYCGEDYEIDYDSQTRIWTMMGFSKAESRDYVGSCDGDTSERGRLNAWGTQFNYNTDGELFYKGRKVGVLY